MLPGSRLMYALGAEQIRRMRARSPLDTKSFHDALLSHGHAPLSSVSDAMGLGPNFKGRLIMSLDFTRRSALQSIILGTAALAAWPGKSAQARMPGGTLTVGLTYDIDTLNVYSTGFLGDVQAVVVEGLLAPNEKAEYVPVLALSVPTLQNGGVKLLDNDSRMQITYKLRPGVKWHDGQPFTSADVKFTWEAVRDPKFIAESKDGCEDILSIDAPDDLTVVCNYKSVTTNFTSTLFTFGILPKHALEGKNLNTDVNNQKPLGTGAFMVREFNKSQYVVADRSPNYLQKAANGDQLPYLQQLVFKIITNSNTLITQLDTSKNL